LSWRQGRGCTKDVSSKKKRNTGPGQAWLG
jgi:hypothetical protein